MKLTVVAGLAATANAAGDLSTRVLALADSLVQCSYNTGSGVWPGELLWESGNTIEALANVATVTGDKSRYYALLNNTYGLTPAVVDNCFDDHQWWMIGWVRSYETTGDVRFLQRAAMAFDYITSNGWEETVCGGGVLWCPKPTSPYKNAITNELFLSGAMKLHPYATTLGRPADYFLNWAQKEWAWFSGSGMINGNNLVNDGLDSKSCKNNGQTTWSYNQGVLFEGLALLTAATGDASYIKTAQAIARATMAGLVTPGGILQEPCGDSCSNDAKIFKGVFVRHLAYLVPLSTNDPAFQAQATAWLGANAASLLGPASCAGVAPKPGGFSPYPVEWQGPCIENSTATVSAGLDLLTAALSTGAALPKVASNGVWPAIGAGNCVDASGQGMPNCYASGVSEAACASAAAGDAKAVAYDFMTNCDGTTFCRVRTTATSCANGWGYESGPATTVTGTNGKGPLTLCAVRQA